MQAFEQLVANRVFQPVAAALTHVTKEFVKYRCIAAREDVKGAVEHLGQTNLKKWFSRNQ
jgi:origin recognition complex subunit 4